MGGQPNPRPGPGNRLARIFWFVLGCATLALGVVLSVKANLGPASWDVLHLAIGQRLGITLGQASIVVSGLILLVTLLLGGMWTVRWGTLVNMFLIGGAIDVYMSLGIPDASTVPARLLYLAAGIFCLALGSVLYTRVALGAGTRDGLILVLSQRLPLTVGQVRLLLEFLVVVTGWLLGGPAGIGTLVITAGTGPTTDLLFRLLGRGWLPTSVRIPEPGADRRRAV